MAMRQLKISTSITNRESDAVAKYLQEISKIDMITPDEEVYLAIRKDLGDTSAVEKLAKANLRFVVSVAKQYQNQGLGLSDLINEGNLGLIKAAQRFDHTRGFKFISYAVRWIRQSILQALAEQSRIVRLPLNKIGLSNKITKAIARLQQDHEREPTTEELAEFMGVDEDEIENMIKLGTAMRHSSLDAPFTQEEEGTLYDVMENPDTESVEETIYHSDLKITIERGLSFLTEREQDVVKRFFGIDGEQLSLDDIGERIGLSRERARQIKDKAIIRLRAKMSKFVDKEPVLPKKEQKKVSWNWPQKIPSFNKPQTVFYEDDYKNISDSEQSNTPTPHVNPQDMTTISPSLTNQESIIWSTKKGLRGAFTLMDNLEEKLGQLDNIEDDDRAIAMHLLIPDKRNEEIEMKIGASTLFYQRAEKIRDTIAQLLLQKKPVEKATPKKQVSIEEWIARDSAPYTRISSLDLPGNIKDNHIHFNDVEIFGSEKRKTLFSLIALIQHSLHTNPEARRIIFSLGAMKQLTNIHQNTLLKKYISRASSLITFPVEGTGEKKPLLSSMSWKKNVDSPVMIDCTFSDDHLATIQKIHLTYISPLTSKKVVKEKTTQKIQIKPRYDTAGQIAGLLDIRNVAQIIDSIHFMSDEDKKIARHLYVKHDETVASELKKVKFLQERIPTIKDTVTEMFLRPPHVITDKREIEKLLQDFQFSHTLEEKIVHHFLLKRDNDLEKYLIQQKLHDTAKTMAKTYVSLIYHKYTRMCALIEN